jgi:hypothetical protein
MAIEKVVNVKVVDNVEATTKNVANLKTQLRQAQNEVNELSAKFGATSEQAVEAAKRAAELKDAIGDAKALTDAFNPDAKFKALTSTLGGVAGGFAAVQGAVGLLGSESQNVEKAILKVQSAMAISQGIQSVGESVDSFKQLGATIKDTAIFQKSLAAATAIQTFVMNGATLAAKAFRGALVATGIGALVVGIGLLIENFDKLKSIIFGGASNAEILNKKLKETISLNDELVSQNERSLKLLEAQGANEEKLFATRQQNLNREINLILGKMDAIDEVYKAELKAGDMTNERKKELEDQYNDFKKQAADKRTEYDINKNAQVVKEVNDSLNEQIKREDEIQASKDKKEEIAKEKRKKAEEEAKEKAKKDAEDLANAKKQQLENTKALENEITQAIGDAQDKNAEMFMTAQEVEERAINDKYFRLKELAIQQGKDINDIEIQQMNEINDVRLAYQATKKEQDEKIKQEDIAREQSVADAKLAIQNAQLDNVSAGINLLKDLGIKNKAIQKGLLIAENAAGIAKIIINTMAGNAKAVAASPLTAGQPFVAVNSIGAGIGIASSIAATAKGLAALGGGGSTGGGSMPSGGSAPAPPQFNIVGQSGTNQLAQTIAGQQNRPIEAFVVSSAVTTSQALDRNRVRTATFGG